MANVIIDDTNLTNIANAIRGKNGTLNTYLPSEMATAITNIPSGGSAKYPWADRMLDDYNVAYTDGNYINCTNSGVLLSLQQSFHIDYFDPPARWYYSNATNNDIGDSIFDHLTYVAPSIGTSPQVDAVYFSTQALYKSGGSGNDNWYRRQDTPDPLGPPTELPNRYLYKYTNDTARFPSVPTDVSPAINLFTDEVTVVNSFGIIIGVYAIADLMTAIHYKTISLDNGIQVIGNNVWFTNQISGWQANVISVS